MALRSGKRRLANGLFFLAALCLGGAATAFSGAFLASIEDRFGAGARKRLEGWESLVGEIRNVGEAEKLEATNRFMNRVRFLSDEEHWGQRDYWATPVEFLATNGGDCEDFSIAKYTTLRVAAVDDARLRIVYVRALTQTEPHMVVAYYARPDAEPLILDNLDERIRPASERTDLIPVYSFNGQGLWRAVGKGRGRRVGGAARLSAWTNVLARMETERAAGGGVANPGEHGLARAAQASPGGDGDRPSGGAVVAPATLR